MAEILIRKETRGDGHKDVICSVCKRKLTVRDHEYPPYYCYRCDEELEQAQR